MTQTAGIMPVRQEYDVPLEEHIIKHIVTKAIGFYQIDDDTKGADIEMEWTSDTAGVVSFTYGGKRFRINVEIQDKKVVLSTKIERNLQMAAGAAVAIIGAKIKEWVELWQRSHPGA